MVEKEDLLIFKMREKKAAPEAQPPAPQPEEVPEEVVTPLPEPVAAEQPVKAKPKKTAKPKKQKKEDFRAESRYAAKGLFCEWHPWRPAYSVCYTCHKPFCYEDVSEYNNKYYCLEDIDAATISERPQLTFGYNKISMVSASAFLLTMLVYIYFVNSFLIYIGVNAIHTGIQTFLLSNFIKSINITYVTLLIGLLILLFVFIGGLLIFAQSRKGYWLSIFSGSISFIFFSYIYITNFSIYGIIISALVLAGLISLRFAVNSKTTEESTQEMAPQLETFTYNMQTPAMF